MKKATWVSVLTATVGFMVLSNDPLNDTVNFIIAGSIPGTNLSIGFWSTLLLAAILLWCVHLGFKKAKLQMLEHTATQIKAEQAKAEFEDSNKTQFNRKNRSVIAARSSESTI